MTYLCRGGERARVPGGLREPDQQQRERGDGDRRDVVADQVEARQLGRRQPARHVADERDPVRLEVEHARREDPRGDEHERARNGGGQEAQAEDQPQREHPDDDRRPVHVAERADPRAELAPRVLALRVGPGELGQLADHDVDGGARQEPGDHGLREEARDPSQPQQRERRYSSPVTSVIAATSSAASVVRKAGDDDRASRHGGQRRAGSRGDLARRAEERVDDRARGRRVQAVLQRHAGDPGVAEILRDDERRDGDPGGDVAPQPPALVGRQPLEDREPGGHGRHHLPRGTWGPRDDRC